MTTTHEAPDILSAEFARDPYPSYRVMRDEFPLLQHPTSGHYLLSRFDDVSHAYKDAQTFSSENFAKQMEPVIGRSVIQMGGHEHSVNRKLITPALRGRYLDSYLPKVEQRASELISLFAADGEVELVEQFSKWFPINIVVDMLDIPKADLPKIQNWYSSLMAFIANVAQDPEVHAWGMRTQQEYPAYMLPIIAERRLSPGDDLISRLCATELDGEILTDEQIKALIGLLLLAGGETTDKAIAGTMSNLIQNPEQLAEVRADRSLVTQAVAENLRLNSPVQIILRTTTCEVEMAGGVIPEGSIVALMMGAANRDERRFANPDVFDLHRADLNFAQAFSGAADHVAFGGGRHFCVGSLLAKREMESSVLQLLDAMPNVRFRDGVVPSEVGFFTRGPHEMHLEFDPA